MVIERGGWVGGLKKKGKRNAVAQLEGKWKKGEEGRDGVKGKRSGKENVYTRAEKVCQVNNKHG